MIFEACEIKHPLPIDLQHFCVPSISSNLHGVMVKIYVSVFVPHPCCPRFLESKDFILVEDAIKIVDKPFLQILDVPWMIVVN